MKFVQVTEGIFLSYDGVVAITRQSEDLTKSAVIIRGHFKPYPSDFTPKETAQLLEGNATYEGLKFQKDTNT